MHPERVARIEHLGGFVILGQGLHASLAVHPLHPATERAISISLHENERSVQMALTVEQLADLIVALQRLAPR